MKSFKVVQSQDDYGGVGDGDGVVNVCVCDDVRGDMCDVVNDDVDGDVGGGEGSGKVE